MLPPRPAAGLSDQVRAHVLFEVACYSTLFVLGSVGNLLALYKLTRRAQRRSHLNRLILQLTLADLLVILVTIPIELALDLTDSWTADVQIFCQLLQTLRTLGSFEWPSSGPHHRIAFGRRFA